jgi:RHS repeat-associated protein
MYYFHNDVSGIPEELTGPEGDIAWQAQYKTWGNTVSESWTRTRQDVRPNTAEQLPQNLRFQGQYLDRETGLHYNTFRFYDPDVGRFISPDPIGLAGGINLQRYAPNPLSWIDPLGWACWSTVRRNFWKAEVVKNPKKYSPANQERMARGLAPMMRAKVLSTSKREDEIIDVPAELHHVNIPQRIGGAGVHSTQNLKIVTRWEHAEIDIYRHTGSTLKKTLNHFRSWK